MAKLLKHGDNVFEFIQFSEFSHENKNSILIFKSKDEPFEVELSQFTIDISELEFWRVELVLLVQVLLVPLGGVLGSLGGVVGSDLAFCLSDVTAESK